MSIALFGVTRLLVTAVLHYLRLHFLPRLSGLVAIVCLLAAFFELINGCEAQSTHAESLSKFTLALNISRLNLYSPLFIISWHFCPGSPGRQGHPAACLVLRGNFGRAFYSERISDFSQNYREINSFT